MNIYKKEDLLSVPKDFNGTIKIRNGVEVKNEDYPNATIMYLNDSSRIDMAKGWINKALQELNHGEMSRYKIILVMGHLEDAAIDLQCYLDGE